MSEPVTSAITKFGFRHGAALVERMCSDPKTGSVTITITTAKDPRGYQIYVTKTGKVRIYTPDGREMRAEE